MYSFEISNKDTGINLDDSTISVCLKFDKNFPKLILNSTTDIIQGYMLTLNGEPIYCIDYVRLEREIAPFVDESYFDASDVLVIDKETVEFKIHLSDLCLFNSMEHNIPNTSDELILHIKLYEDLMSVKEKVKYELVSIRFDRVAMPPLDNNHPRKISYNGINIYTKHSKDGEYYCKVFHKKNMKGAFFWFPYVTPKFFEHSCPIDQLSENVYSVPRVEKPYEEFYIHSSSNMMCILVVKQKFMTLKA